MPHYATPEERAAFVIFKEQIEQGIKAFERKGDLEALFLIIKHPQQDMEVQKIAVDAYERAFWKEIRHAKHRYQRGTLAFMIAEEIWNRRFFSKAVRLEMERLEKLAPQSACHGNSIQVLKLGGIDIAFDPKLVPELSSKVNKQRWWWLVHNAQPPDVAAINARMKAREPEVLAAYRNFLEASEQAGWTKFGSDFLESRYKGKDGKWVREDGKGHHRNTSQKLKKFFRQLPDEEKFTIDENGKETPNIPVKARANDKIPNPSTPR